MRWRMCFAVISFSMLGCSVLADDKKNDTGMTDEEMNTLKLINDERGKRDLPALKPHAKLLQAARSHSENMAKQNKLAHDLDGKTPEDRINATGYKHVGWGENCCYGQQTPAQVLATWMNSPPHRDNMLGKYAEAGLAKAVAANGTPYYTLVLANPVK